MSSRKTILTLAFLIVLPLLVTSCFWGDEFDTHQLTGRYYLSKTEPGIDEWNLYFDDETNGVSAPLIVRPIVAIGYNERCIIAQVAGASPQFYIVLMTNTVDIAEAQANVRGPIAKDEFWPVVQEINGDTVLQFNPSLTKSGW